ncbi:MAG: GNAT family N-acetyltransferase [Dehalococcoidia bacterium]
MPTSATITIERLDGPGALDALPALADILCDCVDGGASVGFLSPLTTARAEAFWGGVATAVARGDKALFAARDGAVIQGTVQLGLALPENQPHRADVAKLLVHRRARRRGIAEALMFAAEREAVAEGRTILTLDTASADAERLYQRLGWTLTGIIPGYALNPDGSLCDTAVYWKHIP